MKQLGALTCIAVTLFATLALAVPAAAQEQSQKSHQTYYSIQDLGTLGGTFSFGIGINNQGSVTGVAKLPGDIVEHTFLWRKGVMTDLGTLGGQNSFPLQVNDRDEVAGSAEISTPDPFAEECFNLFSWTGSPTGLECVAFLWKDGVMTPLPTLGGNNVRGQSLNNHGQVVGGAENSMPGDNCEFQFQLKPVIWQHGQIEELPTLPGDAIGLGLWINNRGQVVGWSRPIDCTVQHAVLWEKGTVTDLGSLGGTFSWPYFVNDQGQVVGISYLPGDVTGHAVLWQKESGIQDLGTLPGDFFSYANGIDNKGRVIGGSFDASFNERAFLWQAGVMTDLNTLIPAGSSWFLIEAASINPAGEIVGAAVNLTTGELHAFLATPTESGAGSGGEALALQRGNVAGPTVMLPDHVRKLIRQRHEGRFGVGPKRPQ